MRTASVERSPFLLDSSAILTLLEDEAGAARVEEVILEEKTLLPWPVLLEVYYISQQEAGPAEADRRYALLKQLPCEILWQIDESILLTAARFKAEHRLSLADALIAAFARNHGA
ncbi:MAG TPA: PIN domain-containing protein, partial [Thermoanaerobaculia bacterium]|nr:PIN domain-containing protein [Thermoanaerobaculia bacterium]